MEFLDHAHSGLRYIVLLMLLITIAKAFGGWFGKKTFTPLDRKLGLFTIISVHVQALLGLILYFANKWYVAIEITDPTAKSFHRFFRMEHIAGMLVAVILITIGNARAKRGATDEAKFKQLAIWFTIGLVLILAMIPWPFMAKFSQLGWF